MFQLKIKRKFVIAAVLGIGLALLGKFVIFNSHVIPREFAEARLKSSAIAQSIVIFSNNSLKNLDEIARYDRQGNSTEALFLISKELIKNRETQESAIKLSAQLEAMAKSISRIKPSRARELATAAVTSEVALVSRLLSYNNYLTRLFEILQIKFSQPYLYDHSRIAELIVKINEEARAINEFDQNFQQSISEFDKIFQ